MNKIKGTLSRIPIWVSYIAIVVGAILSYMPAREVMIAQDAWVIVIRSGVTLNFILLLFLWGVLADRWTKKMPKKKGWFIWGIGFILIIVVYKVVGGYDTIFGLFYAGISKGG